MKEIIEKKLNTAKVWRVIMIALIVGFVGSFVAMIAVDDVEVVIVPLLISAYGLLISALVYFCAYHPIVSSIKRMGDNDVDSLTYDIDTTKPTLPRSKIYCGQRALFSKKPWVILPYKEIAWVHVFEQKMYGMTVQKSVYVYTRSKKRYVLSANIDEFKWLLENYIIKNAPDVIIGYGSAQKERYKQMTKK